MVDQVETKDALIFKKFEDIPVSTKTFIVMTNITVDIKKLFDFLPITEYTVVPKRRGRKKKNTIVDPNKNIPDGSIITLDLANTIRGVVLKKKKKKEGKVNDYFRNSVTVVMVIDGKKINFKISRNGKFQMTGCKYDHHAETCVKYIWEYLKGNTDIYTLNEKSFKALFIPAMRNIDFSLGFILDREKLDEYFNTYTNYYSLLETSIGYTGVNIKIPVTKPITDLKIKELTYKGDRWLSPKFIPYQKYLDTLKPKEQQKKIDKERFNTFLVFHSGKTICSSMCEEFARDTYYEFIDIIKKNYRLFEEKLTTS
jgi:TATA-box binding protein (TBP) (component of TFIID and TFIIIB)